MLQTCARYASRYRGRRGWFIAALCAIVMVSAALVLATLGLGGGNGNQAAANSAPIQEATAKLKANGCLIRLEARTKSLVPNAHLAPAAVRSKLMKFESRHVVLLGEAQITAENIALMNRYPDFDVILFGPTITDASLLDLSKLTHLSWLRVEDTVANQPGLTALGTARPDIRISFFNAAQTGRPASLSPAPAQTAAGTSPPVVKQPLAWDSQELQDAGRLLRASGCLVQLEACKRSSLPADIEDNAPQFILDFFSRTERECYMEAGGKLFTPVNIDLMNRYPILAIAAQGPDVTDVELESVARIKPLKTLWLDNTAATNDGMNAFHLARPDVTVVIGSRQNPVWLFQPTPTSESRPATSPVK